MNHKRHHQYRKGVAGVALMGILLSSNYAFAAKCKTTARNGSVTVDYNQVSSCMEERFGFDPDMLRRAQQKVDAPSVRIFFDRTNPKDGEKVTASIFDHRLFKTAPEDQYYTWYILHTDGEGNVRDSDEDGDLSDEIENGKREAMGRVSRGSFDPILFAVPRSEYTLDDDSDKDSFIAPYGGVNGVGAKRLKNETLEDDKDGIPDESDNCDDEYNPDQQDTDLDGKGDVCDSDIDDDGDSNANDNCVFVKNDDQDDTDDDGLGDACDSDSSSDNDKDDDGVSDENDNCPKDDNPNQQNTDGDNYGDACDEEEENGDELVTNCGLNQYEQENKKGVVATECITRCYKHNFGTKAYFSDDADEDIQIEASSDGNSGKDMVIECEHEFPKTDPDTQKINYEEGTLECADEYTVGDGEFTNLEEACWRLDPNNPDTDGDGVYDEADVAGLNQQSFTWNFQPGDRVGVVVEGTSLLPTNESELNTYYKIMWATPGICSANDEDNVEDDGCEGSDDYGFNYLQAQGVSEKGDENLETSLTASPQNPQFDFYETENSDIITVSSVISNEVSDDRFVYYDWSVYRCDDDNLNDCITTQTYDEAALEQDPEMPLLLTPNCQPGTSQDVEDCAIDTLKPLRGMGVKDISFMPKKEVMRTSKEYYRVILKTRRKESDARYSVSDVIIPITQNDIELKLYTIATKEDGTYTLGEEICNQGLYKTLCPVYPNQVVGAKAIPRFQDLAEDSFVIESYAWRLNEEQLQVPPVCPFDKCDWNDTVFFPVVGQNLQIGSLTVNAKREKGENLTAQRMFSINEPSSIIYSDDVSRAWYFQKFDGTEAEDVLETYDENEVTLRADMVPDYLLVDGSTRLNWYINGQEITNEVAENSGIIFEGNRMTFTAGGIVGTSTKVTAEIEKIFTEAEESLLLGAWNIKNPQDMKSESTVEIKYVEKPELIAPDDEVSSLKLFLASTAQNAPKVLLFTLRMMIGLVLIVALLTGVTAAFNPKR